MEAASVVSWWVEGPAPAWLPASAVCWVLLSACRPLGSGPSPRCGSNSIPPEDTSLRCRVPVLPVPSRKQAQQRQLLRFLWAKDGVRCSGVRRWKLLCSGWDRAAGEGATGTALPWGSPVFERRARPFQWNCFSKQCWKHEVAPVTLVPRDGTPGRRSNSRHKHMACYTFHINYLWL